MPSIGDTPSRPEFESIDLGIDVEETDRYIGEAVKGLSAAESEEGRKYRTADGRLVAIVGEPAPKSDEVRATLVYRTEPAVEPATRKARVLFEALNSHAVEE